MSEDLVPNLVFVKDKGLGSSTAKEWRWLLAIQNLEITEREECSKDDRSNFIIHMGTSWASHRASLMEEYNLLSKNEICRNLKNVL